MLQIFKREFQRRNLQLTVTEIVCAFELGFKSEIETDFTQVRLWGCYFHFTKAFWKKVKDLGLFTHYRDDPLLNGFLRKSFAIGYLPFFHVREKSYQLMQNTNARFLKNAYPQLVFFSSKISKLHGSPIFLRMSKMSMRALILYIESTQARDITTDSMSECGKRVKPNFWIFWKLCKKKKKLAKANYLQYRLGYRSPPQRKKWRDLTNRIFNLKNRFESRNVNIDDYRTNISHFCQNI